MGLDCVALHNIIEGGNEKEGERVAMRILYYPSSQMGLARGYWIGPLIRRIQHTDEGVIMALRQFTCKSATESC